MLLTHSRWPTASDAILPSQSFGSIESRCLSTASCRITTLPCVRRARTHTFRIRIPIQLCRCRRKTLTYSRGPTRRCRSRLSRSRMRIRSHGARRRAETCSAKATMIAQSADAWFETLAQSRRFKPFTNHNLQFIVHNKSIKKRKPCKNPTKKFIWVRRAKMKKRVNGSGGVCRERV